MRKIILLVFLTISAFLIAQEAFSAGLVPCGGPGEPDCELGHFFEMIDNIIDFFLFTIIPPIAVLMLIIGGLVFLLSGGSPEVANLGKRILRTTIFGLVLAYGAWVIINTILTLLGYQGTWYQLPG